MAEPLDSVPDGSDLLIDTNVFVYGLTSKSKQCKTLLERCSSEQITGVTLYEVLHEATHVFMMGEARQKGLFAGQQEKGARYLSRHPEQVKALVDYWRNTVRLLALNVLLLPMELHIVRGAQVERENAGLLTNDSVLVGAMREYGITRIATNDRQFDTVRGISVFSATDIIV